MSIQFIITFALAGLFFVLHVLKRRRQQAYQHASVITGTVLESHYLDKDHMTPGLDVDRGNTLGSYLKVEYQAHGTTSIFETELANRQYQTGETVLLEYLDDMHIRIQSSEKNPYLMENTFLWTGIILVIVSVIGLILQAK